MPDTPHQPDGGPATMTPAPQPAGEAKPVARAILGAMQMSLL
ncbi:hypothetical protein [Paracoccus sp. (in: a-proteobacteria)]|nr:hypothetical protein [Paracoccus sp. (in: a-proteobacteria)]